jgi:hypothetical protein
LSVLEDSVDTSRNLSDQSTYFEAKEWLQVFTAALLSCGEQT